jgi:gentisate 1,2-dioxygenase
MAEMVMSDSAARRAIAEELSKFNCRVAQPDDPPVFTATPSSSMQVCHWRAQDLDHLFKLIGAHLKLEAGGQRRTVRLTNPGLPFGTTPTFWASLQVILPGEVATAHRHSPAAFRFIMKGHGADTIVDGERYEFTEGDLVLTPGNTWHDHEHKGSEPMVWLDVLDISLVRSLHAMFFEPSDVPRRAVNESSDRSRREFGNGLLKRRGSTHAGISSPLLVYERAVAERAVEDAACIAPDPFDDVLMEYRNPVTADHALPTLGTALHRLRPGFRGVFHRRTGSSVRYVIRGHGRVQAGDREIDFAPGDFLALPPWCRHAWSNPSTDAPVLMFLVNDWPTLEKLGLFREEAA